MGPTKMSSMPTSAPMAATDSAKPGQANGVSHGGNWTIKYGDAAKGERLAAKLKIVQNSQAQMQAHIAGITARIES